MTTKLHIDMSHGLIDIEGDADLVREIYADFKTTLLNGAGCAEAPEAASSDDPAATATWGDGAGPTRQVRDRQSAPADAARGVGGVTAPLPTWTTSSINAISIDFKKHHYRRLGLKRYLNP
jgi:hypothetical protein